jgi:hypothetical protein
MVGRRIIALAADLETALPCFDRVPALEAIRSLTGQRFESGFLLQGVSSELGYDRPGRPQRAPAFSTLHEARRGATCLERMYRVRLGNLAQLP